VEVVTIKEVDPDDRPEIVMKTLFNETVTEGARAVLGVVSIPPGARIPLHGTGSHEEDEYAVVTKGSIVTMSGGKEYEIASGQATFIPKGEEHWAYNNGTTDCEIIWTLVKR
jgi:quercetin dioxygenase-like cupin family protein